jgi:hypothetical protein
MCIVDQRMLRTLTFTPWSGKPVVYRRRPVSAAAVLSRGVKQSWEWIGDGATTFSF